jgi:protein gp37
MGTNSKIEWTEHTINPWHGCTKVHAGCDHCYAETITKRWGRDIWGPDKPRLAIQSVWNDLYKQQKEAAAAGTRSRVFVGSMMDIFEKPMPLIDHHGNPEIRGGQEMTTENARQYLFYSIVPECPNLIFLFLTKRPSNINKYIPEKWKINPPENVMFGTSPCDQKTFDTLVPQLLQVNGKKFLSIEPLLGPVTLKSIVSIDHYKHMVQIHCHIQWIIVGGESGSQARPMHPDWARTLRDECSFIGLPFFFKQWGEFVSVSMEAGPGQHFTFPNGATVRRLGKKAAGRALDGIEYSEFPWELF